MDASYTADLEKLSLELEGLVQKRAEVDQKIHRLRKAILSLSAHYGVDSDQALAPLIEYENRGLTTGIKQALRTDFVQHKWRSSNDIRKLLIHFGYDLSKYSNAAAVINTVLNRLVDKKFADKSTDDGSVIRFCWKGEEPKKRRKA